MALHLVTGYKGTPHITADDVGAFNAGILGVGDYVLASGNKLAASLVSSNTVKILDGDVVIQGRHISLKKGTYEEVTISNGTTGLNRNDLIVVRYTKDSATGVENCVFAVIQGTETSGTATDPECTTGDILSSSCTLHEMPLYRIPLTGLTVGEPEALFDVSGSLNNTTDLTYKGSSPIKSADDDKPSNWVNLGTGIWSVSESYLKDAPTSGLLLNMVRANTNYPHAHQILLGSKTIYYRDGLTISESWNSSGRRTWIEMYSDYQKPFESDVYKGTGKYGRTNQVKLTFDFKPSFLVISRGGEHMFLFRTQDTALYVSPVESEVYQNYVTWGDDYVSWYNETSDYYQANASGAYYHYFAAGEIGGVN